MMSLRVFRSFVAASIIIQIQAAPYDSQKIRRDVAIPDDFQEALKKVAEKAPSRTRRKVPPAVAEKAMEIGGEMAAEVAKELVNKIGAAGDRAAGYLENGATVDVQPQNGFLSSDMFAPPAWHIEADVDKTESEEESTPVFNTYPMGIGQVMMNGCWGTNYKPGDPCYKSRVPTKSTCVNLIDSAAFIGTGFDGRGEYSPDSRKQSIIQRNCAGLATYDGYDVPDTMNVHGIYETESKMMTFSDRFEYSSYLQKEAGVSGSFLFFSAGVTTAYGSAFMANVQQYLSVMDVDVLRYEIFKDVVTANDLTPAFLKEFMDLPSSYLTPGAPFQFQDFIQRWGTHYIKSGVFGGRLEIRKVDSASFYSSVQQFSKEAKIDYDSFFSSFHVKKSTKSGSSLAQQTSYSSLSIQALGGEQQIAALVSDQGSPTIKTDVMNWLESIPDYPKAFKFGIGPITDVLHFRAEDIFPSQNNNLCSSRSDLQVDPVSAKKYYLVNNVIANVSVQSRVYCNYDTKEGFLRDIALKRNALDMAIGVYMSEGLVSQRDMTIKGGSSHCELEVVSSTNQLPDWNYLSSGNSFSVVFDMLSDITGSVVGEKILKDELVVLHYSSGMWFLESGDGKARLIDGYSNGGSNTLSNQKISIKGLVLTFVSAAKMFQLKDEDFAASVVTWPDLNAGLKGHYLARVAWPITLRRADAAGKNFLNAGVTSLPCNTHWSNIQTFDILKGGVCVYFAAVSEGSIYVVFSAVPKDKKTWYYMEISPSAVAIHKHKRVLAQTSNKNARGLGDPTLHQGYFACVETYGQGASTLIEYGKYMGDENQRIIYLSYTDKHSPIQPRFYAFGSGNKDVSIFHVGVPARKPPTSSIQCGLGTSYNASRKVCELNCHPYCDSDYGCMISESGIPTPHLCNECKEVKKIKGTTVECDLTCPIATVTVNGKEVCPCKWSQDKCVSSCPAGTLEDPQTHICTECTKALDFVGPNNKVRITDNIPRMSDITMCLWFKLSVVAGEPHIVSYSVPGNFNELLVSLLNPVYFGRGSTTASSSVNGQDMNWHHLCITWQSSGGRWNVYNNGLLTDSGTGFFSGGSITGGGIMILGQEQDSLGGGFESSQAFRGLLTGFNIWSRVLTPIEVANVGISKSMKGDVVAWNINNLETTGEVNEVCVIIK